MNAADFQSIKLPEDATVQLNADTVQAGTYVTVTFTFQDSSPVEMDVPVLSSEDDVYSGITVGPLESPATS
jgi:hypothetical protein